MKRIVKVLKHSDIADIVINEKGDCYDLIAVEDCEVKPGRSFLISLGVSIQLPKGCIAKIYDRSSTPKKYKMQLANSVGIIDNSYNSEKDIWKYQAATLKTGHGSFSTIKAGDRICQFEICLSQKATVWQKLMWLFTSGYKFKYVECLNNEERGGFGEGTGNPK